MMRHIGMLSGGVASWAAMRRVVDREGTDGLVLVFADTLIEDAGTYRFMLQAAANLAGRHLPGQALRRVAALVPVEADDIEGRRRQLAELRVRAMTWVPELYWLADGRTPWEVFRDTRFVGNTRADPCSRVLKRELVRDWLHARFEPGECTVYLGLDALEVARVDRARPYWAPYDLQAPLCEPAVVDGRRVLPTKEDMRAEAEASGLEPSELYREGFPHSNCGGFCVKAGHAHFEMLLRRHPRRYDWHARQEEARRAELGDVAVLRDRTRAGVLEWMGVDEADIIREHKHDHDGNEVVRERTVDGREVPNLRPLPLVELRQRVAQGREVDMFDWGGCGCMSDIDDDELCEVPA